MGCRKGVARPGQKNQEPNERHSRSSRVETSIGPPCPQPEIPQRPPNSRSRPSPDCGSSLDGRVRAHPAEFPMKSKSGKFAMTIDNKTKRVRLRSPTREKNLEVA